MSNLNHFTPKSLTVYGIAISSVVILFKIVSIYGETHLKSAPNLKGLYPITITQNYLPACLSEDELVLSIQQSGIYLSGNLLANNENLKSLIDEKTFLQGLWKNNRVNLSGSLPYFHDKCGDINLEIIATFDQKQLTGEISLNSGDRVVLFTAKQAQIQPANFNRFL